MEHLYDLVIRDARVRGREEERLNVAVHDGRIGAITAAPLRGKTEVNAEGNLLSPSFVDAHLHLCKVYTLPMIGDEVIRRYAAGAMERAGAAIDLASAVKAQYAEGWIYENARRALLEGLRHGVTHVGAFVDTDTRARLEAVKAVLRLREELRGIVEVRVVAFPQDGVLRDPGADAYVREALDMGADVVGGIPWIERTDTAAQEHTDRMFRLAKEFDRDVAFLVDDAGDPRLRTTEMLAKAALREGWVGRVTACHARAMRLYPEPYLREVIELARQAGMGFVTDPHTGALHFRFAELLERGVPVALGQDDIADAYYPYGRHNMLEVAFLASHIAGVPGFSQIEMLFDMITTLAARVMQVEDYGVELGRAANLVVLRGETVLDALRCHAAPRYVISHGRLVAETVATTRFHM